MGGGAVKYRIEKAPGIKNFFLRIKTYFWKKDGYFEDAQWILENTSGKTNQYAVNNLAKNGWMVIGLN
jgi:hypothetical protein